jgi:hypothetical protein
MALKMNVPNFSYFELGLNRTMFGHTPSDKCPE